MLTEQIHVVSERGSVVDVAIHDALRDAAETLEARRIRVEASLASTVDLRDAHGVLRSSLYTIFRGVPWRLAPGGVLAVRTVDKAGGDIELSWGGVEVQETGPARGETPRGVFARGPNPDLFEVALVGLERFCRTRGGVIEKQETASGEGLVRRQFLFLLPSLERSSFSLPTRRGGLQW